MAIAFLPMIGTIAYFIVEILPYLSRDRRLREMRARIADSIDPERGVREALDAVEFSNTIANRIEYGDALMVRERYGAALEEYRTAERMSPHPDAKVGMRIAEAAYQAGETKVALRALDRLPETPSSSERDRRDLLRAKIAEFDGRSADALVLYRTIVDRVASNEVRCRMAAILIERGDEAEARAVLKDVEMRMKHIPPATLKAEAEMYGWVKRTLAELGQGKAMPPETRSG